MTYDSREDSQKHINRVQELLTWASGNLSRRGGRHDRSKLVSPEKEILDKLTPVLKTSTYGSNEYMRNAKTIGEVHWKNNSHHPEYYVYDPIHNDFDYEEVADGTAIRRMSLFDITEMLLDWKAASERHANGDIVMSIMHNQSRFGYSDELREIMLRTAEEMGWIK